MLCLDVSGSMIAYDAAVLEVFEQLTEEFTGERISMVVFNASAVTYFPLTNDYDYIVAAIGTSCDGVRERGRVVLQRHPARQRLVAGR